MLITKKKFKYSLLKFSKYDFIYVKRSKIRIIFHIYVRNSYILTYNYMQNRFVNFKSRLRESNFYFPFRTHLQREKKIYSFINIRALFMNKILHCPNVKFKN